MRNQENGGPSFIKDGPYLPEKAGSKIWRLNAVYRVEKFCTGKYSTGKCGTQFDLFNKFGYN